MKSTKYALLISFVLSALTCSAMKYQIKVLNTPTITIDNKVAKVGDWFDDNSIIAWSKENQAMRVLSEDNHVYTLSAKTYKEAGAKKFSDFIAYTKPLAVRGAKSDDLIEQLRERVDNTFVMLDELVINLSDLDLPENVTFALRNIGDNTPNGCNINIINNLLILNRGYLNIDCDEEGTTTLEVRVNFGSNELIYVTNSFEIIYCPLWISNYSQLD